jgi:hypothetical protein
MIRTADGETYGLGAPAGVMQVTVGAMTRTEIRPLIDHVDQVFSL